MPSVCDQQFRFSPVETVRSYSTNTTGLIDGPQPSGIYMGYTVRSQLMNKQMLAKVQKWGNSQGVRLPKQILRDARISVGDDVEVSARSGRIVVKPLSKSKFDLADLVSRMPRSYKPREESFGKAVGKEEW